jgi:tyrosine-protein kinase Etk/Wzc
LAAAAADGGLSVAAVDLDLRHPQLHSRFGVANEIGAAEIIHGGKTLDEARQAVKTDFGHICLITAGLKSGPPSLLAASGPAALLTRLSESFDLVLVDTPPVLDGGGVLGLAPAASDAVLVARIGRSRPQPATEARQLVEGAGVPVRGVFVVDRPSWRPLSRR